MIAVRRWRLRYAAAAFVLTVAATALTGVPASAWAAPAPHGTAIRGVAQASYLAVGTSQVQSVTSNEVVAMVQAVEALMLTAGQDLNRPPLAPVSLPHLLTNSGNTASSITLNWQNNGGACNADTGDLASLRLVHDINHNGVADPGDPELALGQPGVLVLAAGERAGLLAQGTMPASQGAIACMTLSAKTDLQGAAASAQDTLTVSGRAALELVKSVYHNGHVVPGESKLRFVINGSNAGMRDVQPAAYAATGVNAIMVDNAPRSLVLVRDLIPAATRYLDNTLKTSAPGAIRLYRLRTDPPYSYRSAISAVSADVADVAEVAIGLPGAVAPGAVVSMEFAVRVERFASSDILNLAQAYFNDGAQALESLSNTVVISTTPARLGLAKSAVVAATHKDGLASVRFSLRAKNYGSVILHDVQISDILQGSGATQFGSFAAGAPGEGQYGIVPGSLVLAGTNGVAGIVAKVDAGFTGQPGARTLLAPGATLPVGAELSVQFDLLVNLTGRTGTLLNRALANAALWPSGPVTIEDNSTDGSDPDPDGDGNPGNNSEPTPVPLQMPALTLSKTASLPRRTGELSFEQDYVFRITNPGARAVPHVRLVDNLNCMFDLERSDGRIASWELAGAPVAERGLLKISPAFTGRAACERAAVDKRDAAASLPYDASLAITDGSAALGAGLSETVRLTLRVTEKPGYAGSRTVLANKAWAAGFSTPAMSPEQLLMAVSDRADSLLLDPMGIVYDQQTRLPVAGAVVSFTRNACLAGPAGPISPDQLEGGNVAGVYSFRPDGSVTMTTGADGAYQFTPTAAAGMCTYRIAVTPPAGSGYRFPSLALPADAGTFGSCGAVVPSAQAPRNGEPGRHFLAVNSGVQPGGAACDVTHNHLPLDRGNLAGLVLKKEGSKTQAEFGDFLDYALTVVNRSGVALQGLRFADQLPPGFAYIAGSAQLNGQRTPDPAGGAGPTLDFSFPSLRVGPEANATVRYRVHIGVGAPTDGDAVNRASASSGAMRSNEASFRTRVTGGVFADDGFAFGKVYLDCKPDGVQRGAQETGIPGVRLYLENGTSVVTDAEGKWSLYGLKPVTHVLRLDQTTLPPGAQLALLDNRNAGAPESRFLDIKKGEFHKANFIVEQCEGEGSGALLDEIARRRAAILAQPDAEAEAQVRQRLNAEGNIVASNDLRALPASGQALSGGATGAGTPPAAALIRLPAAAAGGSTFINGAAGSLGGTLGSAAPVGPAGSVFSPLLALPQPGDLTAAPVASLESLLPALDGDTGFIGLHDGQVIAAQVINVRVKGPAGSSLRLLRDDEIVDERRVGKKSTLAARAVTAWEYIGVSMKPGLNRLQVDAVDGFDNVRGSSTITVTAPDKLGVIHIDLPANARADQSTPVTVRVRLTDVTGVPVTARTQLTLETDRGRWLDTAAVRDLNPAEPGMQVFIEGGSAEYSLLPPGDPGDVRVRVSSGNLVGEARLALLPALRPMIGVGIVEGVLDFTKRGKLALGDMPAGAAFENELKGVHAGATDGDGKARAGARSAFFFKGAVKGEYLLTAAFDSDKTRKDRLFRDIRPDEFYPVYGDSATKNFDAQSTQKMYVRIDKNRSYLLYGDFTTSSSAEVRQLSQSNRSLTGIKQVLEDEDKRVTAYASRTAQTQQVEELRALGISGPYYLSANGGEFVVNSEQVEILIRDRNQPGVILQRTPLTRNVDYTIEPMTRRILFTFAIPSININGDPQSIRTTYEIENGGPEFTVAGVDAQFRLGEQVQGGIVASMDDNPANRRRLSALTGIARLGEHTTVASEVVRTESDHRGHGDAARLELRHQQERFAAVALASKTGAGFDNPGASVSAGRTEASARAEYKVDPTLALRGEALYSKDAVDSERRGVSASVMKRLSDMLAVEAGLRHGQNDALSSSAFDYGQASTYNNSFGASMGATPVAPTGRASSGAGDDSVTTVRARATAQVPYVPQAQVFVEGEQDIHDSERRVLAVGGHYALTDKTRLYGRYEAISSLHGPYALGAAEANNVGILGIESNYMEGGRLYNEYRLADSIDGKSAQTALGVRNTFRISDAWRVTGGIEHTRNLSGFANSLNTGTGYAGAPGESTALISGVEYMHDRVKASGVAEGRNGSDANTRLVSAGVAYKLDADWSLLARTVLSDSAGRNANRGNARLLSRSQIGVAYRPVDSDLWNALARYEHKVERVRGDGNAPGSASGSFGSGNASLPGTYTADIVSAHLNVNPARGNYIAARYAAKLSSASDDRADSTYWAHLLQGRYTKDIGSALDIGVQSGLLAGKGGALQTTAGVEVGYQLHRNLWLSGGYNFVGVSDRDLTANEYTSKGAFIRLRWKFDETTLRFPSLSQTPEPLPLPAAYAAPPPGAELAPVALPVAPVAAPLPPVMVFEAETLFDSGKASMKPGEHAALAEFAARLRNGSSGRITVVGHTDAQGSTAYNQALSERRAGVVRAYLVKQGVEAVRIHAQGRGERQPVASNATARGRAMNRRVEIEVLALPATEVSQ